MIFEEKTLSTSLWIGQGLDKETTAWNYTLKPVG